MLSWERTELETVHIDNAQRTIKPFRVTEAIAAGPWVGRLLCNGWPGSVGTPDVNYTTTRLLWDDRK